MALVSSRLGEDDMLCSLILMTGTIMMKWLLGEIGKSENVALLDTHDWIYRTREQGAMTGWDNGAWSRSPGIGQK